MRRHVLLAAAALSVFWAGGFARAGDSMSSPSSALPRNAVTGGGGTSSSSNYKLNAAVGEEGASRATSSSWKLAPGSMSLFSIPGSVSNLGASIESLSSATLSWSGPGYDGALGALQQGSSYYVRVASYTAPDTFVFDDAQVWGSTVGTSPGAAVSSNTPVALNANTTWYATLWLLDADGNVSFTSNRSTFTTLAVAPVALASSFFAVANDSVTAGWAALPAAPAAASANGYVLEASTTNFGGLSPGGVVLTTTTPNVLLSTLSVAGLDFDRDATYYFRVGSLNVAGKANYLALPRLNFQIAQSSGALSFGVIDGTVVNSVVSASSIVVTNVGNWPVTLRVLASTITAGSPWTLGATPDIEQVVLQGLWNSVPPLSAAFNDPILTSTQTSGALLGLYAGDQSGALVPPGQSRTLWVKFKLPTSTRALDKQIFDVSLRSVYP